MDLLGYTPRYITFDCYGTLTNFQMPQTVIPLVADRVAPEDVPRFVKDFRAYRLDEVLGEFKLYPQVLRDSWQRVCNRWRIQFRPSDVDTIVDAVRSWGPHPDVPEPLAKLAAQYPLVILSNAVDWMLQTNVEQLGVDFYRSSPRSRPGPTSLAIRPSSTCWTLWVSTGRDPARVVPHLLRHHPGAELGSATTSTRPRLRPVRAVYSTPIRPPVGSLDGPHRPLLEIVRARRRVEADVLLAGHRRTCRRFPARTRFRPGRCGRGRRGIDRAVHRTPTR